MNEKKSNFTIIKNDVLWTDKLSPRAKIIYVYLLSKPKDWRFSAERMKKEINCGLDYVKHGLKELVNLGLLTRKRVKRDDGVFKGIDYILADENKVLSIVGFSTGGSTTGGKPTNITNTDITNTDITKTEYLGLFFKKPAISSFLGEVTDKEGCTEWLSELVGDVWFHRTPSPLPLTDKNLKLLVEGLSHEEGWEYAQDRMGGTQYFPLPVIQEAKKKKK